jgi:hypothetical protein
MKKVIAGSFVGLCLAVFGLTTVTYSQNTEPSFRVVISTVSGPSDEEITAKGSFKVGETVKVKVEITNLSNKQINIPKGIDYSRPTLFRDGQLVLYRKEIIDREKRKYRSLTGMLYPKPNEMQPEILDLSEFYEPLKPGKYRLSLERRFFKTDNLVSNTVLFEVVSCDKK